MIILLSPAKIQHFSPQPVLKTASQAVFLKEAEELVGRLRELPASELSKLLQINRNLTQLNLDRMLQWRLPFSLENARQAVLVFDGEAFRGLNAKSFTAGDLDFAQQHLKKDGALVCKVFHGAGYSQLVEAFKANFRVCKPIKPKASRDKSAETFLVGIGLKTR